MKNLVLSLVVLSSITSVANASGNCDSAVTQLELNECSSISAQKALASLKKRIISSCKAQEEIKNAEGSSIHTLLINSCVEEKAKSLLKKLDNKV